MNPIRQILLLFSLLVALPAAWSQRAAVIPGEILVQLDRDARPELVERMMRAELGLLPDFRMVKCISRPMRAWLATFDPEAADPAEVIHLLSRTSGVRLAQANHRIEDRETLPDDPFFTNQWHHEEAEDHDIDSELAWDITTGGLTPLGDEIVVCVVETQGARWNHPDLLDNHWVNVHEIENNGVDDDGNGYVDDYHGWNITNDTDNLNLGNHGTQVSSMIGARGNNGTGVTGVNWNVGLMQVQMGGISEANVIEAYTYPLVMRKLYNESNGTLGAFVVATNSSWGTNFGQPDDAPLWCAMYDSLGHYGVLSSAATTNSNYNVDEEGDLPTACPSAYLISVTATDNQDERPFSGYGPVNVDLGAPGEDVYLASGTTYGTTSGTSFASPCAAGAVALLYSAPCTSLAVLARANPPQAAALVREYVLGGTDAVPGLEGDCLTGGRLNLFGSLTLLLSECDASACIPPFSLSANPAEGGAYVIEWEALAGMESFTVRYRLAGDEEWTVVPGVPGTSYLLTGLPECGMVEIAVSGMCGPEQSDWSAPATFLTTGCCANPAAVFPLQSGGTSLTFGWEPVPGVSSYQVTLSGGGQAYVLEGVEGTSAFFANLEPCSSYTAVVVSDCTSGSAPNPPSFEVTTGGCTSCEEPGHCTISGDADVEWISQVTIGPFSQSSGPDSGYGDYTGEAIPLEAGGTYPISCTPDFANFSYSEYFLAWLDFNANGAFEPTELIFDPGSSSTQTVSGSFTIPVWVGAGHVRLRVAMSYYSSFSGSLPVPCGSLEYGEAEDYCILVSSDVGIGSSGEEAQDLRVHPNPSTSVFTVETPEDGWLTATDATGRFCARWPARGGHPEQHALSVPGMYLLHFTSENGARHTTRIVIH